MNALALGAFGTFLGEPAPLDTLAWEVGAEKLAALAADFDHLLVADGEIWQSAAAAARRSLDAATSPPDLLVYVTQNDTDSTTGLARLTAELGLDTIARIAVSGHECANLGPALQLVGDAIATGRGTRALLVLADHAAPGARMMRNGMSFFSDGAVALQVTAVGPKAPGFEVLVHVEDIAVLSIPGAPGPPSLRASVATVRGVVDALAGGRSADTIVLGHYGADSRTFLHAATGLRSARVHSGARQRSGHIFGSDHVLALTELSPKPDPVVVLALGPWTSVGLLVRVPAPYGGEAGSRSSAAGGSPAPVLPPRGARAELQISDHFRSAPGDLHHE